MHTKLLSALVVSAALIVPGVAFADPAPQSETTGNPEKGNQGCGPIFGQSFKNPGKTVQFSFGFFENPNTAARDLGYANVGAAIDDLCGPPG